MKRIVFTFLFCLLSFIFASAQTPQGFNYQAMARDAQGNALANKSVTVNLQILEGSATGTVAWEETHTVTTNDFGIFSLMVGDPAATAGSGSVASFDQIDWSTGSYFLKVSVNGTVMGTPSQLLAVPYAAFAQEVANKDDADPDPANEIQDLQISGNLLTITLNQTPTTIDLSPYFDNTDSQQLSISDHTLSLQGGGSVTLPDNVNDADANPSNEIQDLNLAGNILTITNNGSATQIDLSPYMDNPGWNKAGIDTLTYSGSVAIGTTQPMGSKLAVTGGDVNSNKALFEVKRSDGQTVFAVYNDSIRMYVNASPTTKGSKGGFAVSGYGATKGFQDYLRVTPDSVRVYIDQTATKRSKGGFAVSGFGSGKGSVTDLMYLGKDNYFIGHESGTSITTGLYNSFFGYQAGRSNTTGNNNVFLGYQSGYHNMSADNNVFIGNASGFNTVNGFGNVYIGLETGWNNRLGKGNSFIGYQTGRNNNADYNSFFGYQSGYNNSSGTYNVFMGYGSGYSNTTGGNNIFMGNWAGYGNTTGNRNIIIGYLAGRTNTSGSYNIFLGDQSGYKNTANYNSFIGYTSGFNNTTGTNNVFLGYRTGYTNSTGQKNIFIGNDAGYKNTIGGYNIFVGTTAGYNNVDGNYNIFMGFEAGDRNQSGSYNVFIGQQSGWYNTTGTQNSYYGYQSGLSNTTGSYNAMMGLQSGLSNTTGNYNSYLGYQSAYYNTTGQKNVAIGYRAGRGASGVSTGSYNVFIGNESGYSNTTGQRNTFVGDEAGHSNTTGFYNTFVGYLSGFNNVDAYYNTFIGYYAGYSSNNGFNTMIGYHAGFSNVEGVNAAYIGYKAGYSNTGTDNTFLGSESGYYNAAGSGNVFVGLGSGRHSDGNDNVFIGKYAGYSETGSSKLVINSGYTGSDNAGNALIYGNFSTKLLRFNGAVGINRAPASSWALGIDMDTGDNYGLVVNGPTWCSSGSWAGSDRRLKKNITSLQNPLQKLMQLRGVNFYWKTEEFSNRHFKDTKQIGVIAQEVEKVFPELVQEGPEGFKSVDYSKFSAVFIEAIKEQQKEIELLKQEIELLKKQK